MWLVWAGVGHSSKVPLLKTASCIGLFLNVAEGVVLLQMILIAEISHDGDDKADHCSRSYGKVFVEVVYFSHKMDAQSSALPVMYSYWVFGDRVPDRCR